MEQRCHLSAVWLTWVGLPLLAVVVGFRAGILAGVFTLAVGIVAQVLTGGSPAGRAISAAPPSAASG